MATTRPAAGPSGGLATQYAPPLDLPFRFLATALATLLILALTYFLHTPLLLGGFYDRHLLAFVHVNTLGVIGATIFGASYQLLPVVLQRPLASVRAARLSWWLFVPGLLAFLAGLESGQTILLALGGSLLYGAVLLYVGVVALTLASAPYRDVVFWHLAAAATSLLVGASLGALLALAKGSGALGALHLPTLAAHVALMLGGWVTAMLAGVAYRLVGMFTLSEDLLRPGWAWSGLVLIAGGSWALAGGLLLDVGPVRLAGAVALLGGVALFALQLLRLYRLRRRRALDVHQPFALAATLFGLLAAGLLVFGLAGGQPAGSPIWLAAGWLAVAGWAETAIQGFLYKIGTFLTWLRRYAPLAGRQRVPKLEDLYGRRTALAGWAAWTAGVALGALAPFTASSIVALAAALALSAGAGAFLVNAARVGAHWRGAIGARPAAARAAVTR